MEQKITADWCEKTSSKLTAFNRAYIARKGRGLAQDIVLKGDDKSIRFCAAQEARLFAENGILAAPDVITDRNSTQSPAAFLLDNDHGLKRIPGNIYFLRESSAAVKNEFYVKGCAELSVLEDLVNALGFDGLTAAVLKEALKKYKNTENILANPEMFVNNTLIRHFEKQEDNVFHEEDLSWIKQTEKNLSGQKEKYPETPQKEPEDFIKPQENTQNLEPEENIPGQDFSDHAQKASDIPQESPNQETAGDTGYGENAQKYKEENQNNGQQEADGWKQKEILTPEETERNYQMLERLKQEYQATLSYAEGLHNGKWKTLIGQMKQALETSKFNQQLCLLYMKVSDDYSSELYKQIYRLDEITEQFNNAVIHQVAKVTCSMCGHTWEENITFLTPGLHFLECPNCYTEKGYDKKC